MTYNGKYIQMPGQQLSDVAQAQKPIKTKWAQGKGQVIYKYK